jgi:hypothetical protein
MTRRALLSLLFVLLLPMASFAQVLESRTYGVRFAAGQTAATLSDTIRGSETVVYRLNARAGQTMILSLTDPSVYFVVFGPGQMPGGASIASSDRTGPLVPSRNRFESRLSASGDYRIEVRLVAKAAARDESAAFTLRASVVDAPARPPAGGPTGGGTALTSPFLRVSGLLGGDSLNVRGGPSTGFAVRYTLRNGDIVRNLGCLPEVAGTVWCRVHRVADQANEGWASARYLVPAAAPGGGATQLPGVTPPPGGGATQLPGDALVPGTGYNATGTLACTISGRANDCRFGVIRRGNGSATLDITMPNGAVRKITFTAGRPVSSNASARLYAEWVGRDVMVAIGTTERYAVPDAVLWGG